MNSPFYDFPGFSRLIMIALFSMVLGLTQCTPTTTDRPGYAVQGDWTEQAPLPEERTEVSATTDGIYIYLSGGFGPPDENGDPTAPRTVWQYDPQPDEWASLTEIPNGLNHAPMQYYEGRLFVLGGFLENTFEPTGDVHIFDLDTEEWSEGASMPTPRGASGWTVLDGRIHVLGGNAQGPEATEVHADLEMAHDRSVNTHEAYDPDTDSWEELAPMPTPRNHLGAASLHGRIHAVLGRVEDDYTLTTHEIYNPQTDSWETGPDVPTGRSGVAVLEYDGYMYAFGGEGLDEPNQRTFDDAERYNPDSEQWEQLPPMPTARHGLGGAVVDNSIYLISGGPEPGFHYSDANERLQVRPGLAEN